MWSGKQLVHITPLFLLLLMCLCCAFYRLVLLLPLILLYRQSFATGHGVTGVFNSLPLLTYTQLHTCTHTHIPRRVY